MKTQLLIGAGIITLALTGLFLIPHKTTLESSEPKQTRDFLQLCVIRSCYHFFNSCKADADCKTEMEQFTAAYFKDYTQYDTLVAGAQHPDLVAALKCENDCGLREYLEDCGSVQSLIYSCPSNATCVSENQDYFDNVEACTTREYKACNGLEGDAYDICYQSELVFCFSDGIEGTNTDYENALLCA